MAREYELNETEQRHMDVITEVVRQYGGMVEMDRFGDAVIKDGAPVSADYIALRGGKHLVDKHMRVWQMRARGTPQFGIRGGTPCRSDYVIMWTGAWNTMRDDAGKPILGEDDKPVHVKYTVAISLAKNVNAHRGASNIDWHINEKGFKHPLDPPDAPDERLSSAQARRDAQVQGVVLAKAVEAGIDPDVATGKAKPPPLGSLTVMKLRSIATQRGMDVSDISGDGAKEMLISRITAAEAGVPIRSNKRESA